MITVGLGGVLEVCGECYNMIVLLFLFCLPLLTILFLKTKRNDLAPPVMGTIFLVNVLLGERSEPHTGVFNRDFA